MQAQNYKYGNNGEFPFRYVVSRGRSKEENLVSVWDYETNRPNEINLNSRSLKNLNKGFSTSGISSATKRKISKHCKVLALSSVRRKVKNWKGFYTDHLCTFITLTLPSVQIHEDKEITKIVLGNFLDRCRKLGLLTNYVWKAEKQKNGNIHYHILTDTYASFSTLQNIWFLALDKLDYVKKYTEKFSSMSFLEYSKQSFNSKKTPSEIASAYGKGIQNKWKKPPALHSVEVSDIKAIANYVSKYISKSNDNAQNCVSGRTWSASQSVTQSVKTFCTSQEISELWYKMSDEILKKKRYVTDFFSMVFCSVSSICAWFPDIKKDFKKLLSFHFTPCPYWSRCLNMP